MRRRAFVLGAAAASWAARGSAQPSGNRRRLGVLFVVGEDNPEGPLRIAALREALAGVGWSDTSTLQIDYRFGAGDPERIRHYADELIELRPDVLLAQGVVGTAALQRATNSIPVVFVQMVDPIGGGFVASLASPGRNITGFTDFEYTIGRKWLELLKEAAPAVSRALLIINPENRARWNGYVGAVEGLAPSLGVKPVPIGVANAAEIENAFATFVREPNGGVVVLPDATTAVHLGLIVDLAARHRVPAAYPYGYYARSGGLMAYSSSVTDQYRRAASYVDRLLRGADVTQLPVQASERFELILNLRTASALNLAFPPALLARADEVIE
jgi:putative ABC transport system substrate-binding protein